MKKRMISLMLALCMMLTVPLVFALRATWRALRLR